MAQPDASEKNRMRKVGTDSEYLSGRRYHPILAEAEAARSGRRAGRPSGAIASGRT